MSKITDFFNETKSELKHVAWPTKQQTVLYTVLIIVLSLVVAYLLGLFDFIFSFLLEKIISL